MLATLYAKYGSISYIGSFYPNIGITGPVYIVLHVGHNWFIIKSFDIYIIVTYDNSLMSTIHYYEHFVKPLDKSLFDLCYVSNKTIVSNYFTIRVTTKFDESI